MGESLQLAIVSLPYTDTDMMMSQTPRMLVTMCMQTHTIHIINIAKLTNFEYQPKGEQL